LPTSCAANSTGPTNDRHRRCRAVGRSAVRVPTRQAHPAPDGLRRAALAARLHSLEDYIYLGFGSWEFVDFRLIRRELGVRRMISIERDTNAKDRYAFNRPFADVDLQFGDRATSSANST
jgi:hypothetical protein